MSYDDISEVLAAALLEKAETVGCLEVLDGFSQRPDTEIEVSAPISEEMLALPLDKQAWPEECTPILKESSAATLGELVEYLNHCTATGKKLNVSEDAAAAMFPALITFCYDAADMNGKRFFWEYILESNSLVFEDTPDAGGEPYVMPPDYMGDAVTITMGAVAAATAPEITEEMYEQLDYLEKHPEENYYENEENFSQYDQGD